MTVDVWTIIETKSERKKVAIMSIMKAIQTTPELSGKDTLNVLREVKPPTEKSLKKNTMLRNVLMNVRKS